MGLPAQGYISTILLRNNTLVPGGLLYKDDPTVLAWELQNEPQLREGYEKCAAAAVPDRLHPQRCRLPFLLACSVLAHKDTARACASSIVRPMFPMQGPYLKALTPRVRLTAHARQNGLCRP